MAALRVSEIGLLERYPQEDDDDQSIVQGGDKSDPDSRYMFPGLPKEPWLSNRPWLLGWPITMNELAQLPFKHDGWPRGDFLHGILWLRQASTYEYLFIGNVLAKEGDSHHPTYSSVSDDKPTTSTHLISIFVGKKSWMYRWHPPRVSGCQVFLGRSRVGISAR